MEKYTLGSYNVKSDLLTKKEKVIIVHALTFNDTEINGFNYKKAFKYDKRNIYQFYFSLLFTKHIVFQIFNKSDYNAIIIIFQFFIVLCSKCFIF